MKVLLTISLLFITVSAIAQNFKERPISDFKMLNEFNSIKAFENYIGDYRQDCLDNSYGGSLSVRCFISYKLWDRGLNKYYQLLRNKLSIQQQKILKKVQQSWIKTRDLTIQMNSNFLDQRYNKQGTMYIAIRAGDASSAISPLIKQRALLLRNWYLDFSNH